MVVVVCRLKLSCWLGGVGCWKTKNFMLWKLNLYQIVELEGSEKRKVLILVVKLQNALWAKNTRFHVQTPVEVKNIIFLSA